MIVSDPADRGGQGRAPTCATQVAARRDPAASAAGHPAPERQAGSSPAANESPAPVVSTTSTGTASTRAAEPSRLRTSAPLGAELDHDRLAHLQQRSGRLVRVIAAGQHPGLLLVGEQQVGAGDPVEEGVRADRAQEAAARRVDAHRHPGAAGPPEGLEGRAAGPGVQQGVAGQVQVPPAGEQARGQVVG